ncbi:MAG: hypothetical protein EOP51_23285 [Sphingobacteriales bacterium]|nr:MAG: hypothetical protein EOP51_23285 [Sphingobacteriales bacterium]
MINYRIFSICLVFMIGSLSFASAQIKTQDEINRDLGIHRKQIDSLDKLLIQVLGNRQRVVREVGIYKKKYNIPPLQPARFKQVLDRAITSGQKEGLSAEFVTEMMNAIHKESLRLEGDTVKHH